VKAVLVRSPGGPEALEPVDLPVPIPGPGQVQLTARAFGVSTPDALIRSGVYAWMPPLPANPGNDVAGVVTAVGPGVTGIELGSKALLSARDLPMRGGCYAEILVAPADAIHPLAPHVDLEQAVCLPNYQVAQALLAERVRELTGGAGVGRVFEHAGGPGFVDHVGRSATGARSSRTTGSRRCRPRTSPPRCARTWLYARACGSSRSTATTTSATRGAR
jgi:NADPH:quinone reductase-like Zn-dependent oxidoreductase